MDADECFSEFIEEQPFDPSAPAAHFQSEVEYLEALVEYLSDREKYAFKMGYATGLLAKGSLKIKGN